MNGSNAQAALLEYQKAKASKVVAPEDLAAMRKALDKLLHLAPPVLKRRRRKEALLPVFVAGIAEGWAFGVPSAFRTQLDMRYEQRVDSKAGKEKKAALGRKLEAAEKVMRWLWTQGDPPAYSFYRGNLFHSPGEVAAMPWKEVLGIVRYSVAVLDAKADPGALVEVETVSEDGDVATRVAEAGEVDKDNGKEGWVDFDLWRYEEGRRTHRAKGSLTQKAFADLLRSGVDEDRFVFESVQVFPGD